MYQRENSTKSVICALEHTWIWIGWVALEEYCCSSIAEQTIDNIRVTCNPTNVSDTGKDVLVRVVVKHILQVVRQREKGRGGGRGVCVCG